MNFQHCMVIFFLFIYSCKNNSQDKKKPAPIDINEKLAQMNRILIENESKRIDEFIAKRSFNIQRTGSGLRYEIYHHGNGEKPKMNDTVAIKYKVFLLDGTLCYANDSSGPLKLRIGVGEQVRGLEEGLMLMSVGDKAHLILPAHLAYGTSGDQGKIPPASSLYYNVELLSLNK